MKLDIVPLLPQYKKAGAFYLFCTVYGFYLHNYQGSPISDCIPGRYKRTEPGIDSRFPGTIVPMHSSIASFIGILGAKYEIYILDGLAGLVVSIIIIKIGVKIFIDCFQQLIDVSIHTDEIDNVKDIIINKTDTKT